MTLEQLIFTSMDALIVFINISDSKCYPQITAALRRQQALSLEDEDFGKPLTK